MTYLTFRSLIMSRAEECRRFIAFIGVRAVSISGGPPFFLHTSLAIQAA